MQQTELNLKEIPFQRVQIKSTDKIIIYGLDYVDINDEMREYLIKFFGVKDVLILPNDSRIEVIENDTQVEI